MTNTNYVECSAFMLRVFLLMCRNVSCYSLVLYVWCAVKLTQSSFNLWVVFNLDHYRGVSLLVSSIVFFWVAVLWCFCFWLCLGSIFILGSLCLPGLFLYVGLTSKLIALIFQRSKFLYRFLNNKVQNRSRGVGIGIDRYDTSCLCP